MRIWICLPLAALAWTVAHADVYRWVDADGKVHYSDHPPPASVKQVEKKKTGGGKPSEAPLPYALQQAVSNFPVTLYTSQCGAPCTQARELLARRGVPYTEADATDVDIQQNLKKLTGGEVEVPVLKVGRGLVRGFETGKWNDALDAAGYPQTAVIPPRPPVKAAPKPAAASPAAEAPAPADAAR
ncbi:MAG TPA: glutaredoxin family protein [Burkholderiales bacterium]|nr:glutaredoxin family protein [Burkholderiales bacterium]